MIQQIPKSTTSQENTQSTNLSSEQLEDSSTFQTGQVITVTSGHFVHDSYTGFLPALPPLIQERLGSSYAGVGSLLIMIEEK